jgi:hypothetical protein
LKVQAGQPGTAFTCRLTGGSALCNQREGIMGFELPVARGDPNQVQAWVLLSRLAAAGLVLDLADLAGRPGQKGSVHPTPSFRASFADAGPVRKRPFPHQDRFHLTGRVSAGHPVSYPVSEITVRFMAR